MRSKPPGRAILFAFDQGIGRKNWVARAAAVEAIAKRGDAALLVNVESAMSDKKDIVRYSASATVLRKKTAATHTEGSRRPCHGHQPRLGDFAKTRSLIENNTKRTLAPYLQFSHFQALGREHSQSADRQFEARTKTVGTLND